MSGKWKPHPSLTDSGVPWLGRVPSHWRVLRLKWAVRSGRKGGTLIKGQLADEPAEGLFPGYSASGQDVWVTEALYHQSGIVLSAVGARCGKAFRADGDWTAIANTHVLMPNRGFDRDFLWRIFDDERFWKKGGSAQPYVQVPDSLDREWAFPDLAEQKGIAAFLDRETAKIDGLVAKKERLIELLQEKRTALISHAVTRGLNPNAPLRDSGIPWIGRIPQHWEVKRMKWSAKLESGHTPDKKIEAYWTNSDIPWVSLADTGKLRADEYIAETEYRTNRLGLAHSSARLLPQGTVVFSRDASIGLCAITTRPMAVSQHFIGWVCGTGITPEFLLFVIRSMTAELDNLTMGATVKTIGMTDVKRLTSPVPPTEEQTAIVAHIRTSVAKLDALIAKVRTAIDRLQEYRTALISAAVTGQIDVREQG